MTVFAKLRVWALVGLLAASLASLLATSLWMSGSKRDFESAVSHVAAVYQASNDAKCAISQEALEQEKLELVSICGEFGLLAYAAAKEYPEISPKIFGTYGNIPEFRELIGRFGPAPLPIIEYFRKKGSLSADFGGMIRKWVEQSRANRPLSLKWESLGEDEYGLYGIYLLHRNPAILGEFIPNGDAKRLFVPRTWNTVARIVTGGIADLEKTIAMGKDPTWKQVGWATVDVGVIIGGVSVVAKSLRAAKAVKTAESVRLATKLKSAGTAAKTAAMTFGTVGAYTGKAALTMAPVAAAYVAITHPSLIASGGAWVAAQAGLPEYLGVFLAFFLPVLVIVYLAWPVWQLCIRPVVKAMMWLARVCSVR